MRSKTHESVVRALGAVAIVGGLFFAIPSANSQNGAPRLQGQVPLADQMSGRALQGYKKNVRLVGHNDIYNRLNNGNLGWLDDCAYVSAYYGANDVTAGLAIVDVTRPRNPRVVRILPGVPGSRESQVEANADSRMVVVMTWPTTTYFGDPPAERSVLHIYDVVGSDCTNLVKRSTYDFGLEDGQVIVTHEHAIWRDKIYATVDVQGGPGPALSVIDVSDRTKPTLLAVYRLPDEQGAVKGVAHDLEISPDGTRVYMTVREPVLHGMSILDTSEVAAWKPGMPTPRITRVAPYVYWGPPMPGASHSSLLVKIKGRKYVLVENEGSGGSVGGCPAGYAQIIDVTDERNPAAVSTFLLDVNRAETCPLTMPDHAGVPTTGPVSILINMRYNAHYLGVDNPEDPKIAAFTWYSSGLRLVDISDPYNPKEVGYFIPPAINIGGTRSYPDRAYSFVRFHRGNIWFNSVNGGFWVVRLTHGEKDGEVDDD